jgi:proteasome lid subunit RPN8/RPN11
MEEMRLNIPEELWIKMVLDLKTRGRGKRESGAFILGPLNHRDITHYICYDDLDPHCLDSGIIEFDHSGFTPLWRFCEVNKVKVYADVHTHPGSRTRQSGLDINNPMIRQAGHLALIMPDYAQRKSQFLNGVGIYEYLGDKKWKTLQVSSNIINIKKKNYGIFRRYFQQVINWYNRKK